MSSQQAAKSPAKKTLRNKNEVSESDMKPLGHALPRTGLAFRMNQEQQQQQQQQPEARVIPSMISLQEACRHVIVANLERYPPESLGVIDSEEWNTLLHYRHQKTKPKSGHGGLDGTGRMAPALSDKFLLAVEESHPDDKVKDSPVADELLWKDCVNYTFRKGGLTRPLVLHLPWPLLVERIQHAGNVLLSYSVLLPCSSAENDTDTTLSTIPKELSKDLSKEPPKDKKNTDLELKEALSYLEGCPMNVDLLMESGIGKTLKKALKKQQKQASPTTSSIYCERMETLMSSWKTLAHQQGVQGVEVEKAPPQKKRKVVPPIQKGKASSSTQSPPRQDDPEQQYTPQDWKMAKTSHSWRQLFAALKQREETRRSNQGAKMRQIRQNLNNKRPKVVKVRPADKPQHERILQHSVLASRKSPPPVGKLAQIKREAHIVSSRQNRGEATNTARLQQQATSSGRSSMFSLAVAGAQGGKGKGKRKLNAGQAIMRTRPIVQKNIRNKMFQHRKTT